MPKKLSEQLDELAANMLPRVEAGMGLTCKDLQSLLLVFGVHANCARALEKMLERRLKASEIPWRGEPNTGGGAPPAAGKIVQLVPRKTARVIPFNGGAA